MSKLWLLILYSFYTVKAISLVVVVVLPLLTTRNRQFKHLRMAIINVYYCLCWLKHIVIIGVFVVGFFCFCCCIFCFCCSQCWQFQLHCYLLLLLLSPTFCERQLLYYCCLLLLLLLSLHSCPNNNYHRRIAFAMNNYRRLVGQRSL